MHLPASRRLADISISAKVFLAPGFVLLVLLGFSVASLHMLGNDTARIHNIAGRAFVTYQLAAQAKDEVNVVQTKLQHTISVAANETDRAIITRVAEPARAAANQAVAALDRLQEQLGASDHSIAALRKSFDDYQAAVLDLLKSAETDPASVTFLLGDVETRFDNLSNRLDSYESEADASSRRLAEQSINAADQARTVLLFGAAAAVAISLLVIIVVARMIGRPIVQLTETMAAMATDDLGRDIPALTQRDEIGAMARAVEVLRRNSLTARTLAAERDSLQRRSEEEKRAAMLNMADKLEYEMAATLEAIGSRTAAMKTTAEEMSTSAGRAGASAQSAAAAAADTLTRAQTMAGAAEELAASIKGIGTKARESATIVGQAVTASSDARTTMEALHKQVTRIGVVADMIGEIAAKTNLLALNATIEAARAGDAGKGFAVVAGEVKQLATQTAQSTQEIARHIGQVETATLSSVAAVDRIEQTIGKISTIAGSIATAVQEQGMATAEISRSISENASTADAMAERVREVLSEAEQAGQQGDRVRDDIAGLNANVSELKHSVIRVVRTSAADVDRRLKQRSHLNLRCHVSLAGRDIVTARVVDFSEGGVAIAGTGALPIGTQGKLGFDGVAVSVPFKVVAADENILHVEFTQSASGNQRLLQELEAIVERRAA